MRISHAALVTTLILHGGCGDDGGVADGAVDASADASAGAVLRIPWSESGLPLALTPCPEGWREVEGPELTECEPWPEGGRVDCGPGEAHFIAEAGCRPLGEPCPAGEYADSIPASGPVVYVNSAAPSGGDGTRAAPFSALSEVGWTSLSPGTTVALARGSYEGVLSLRPGVRVVGACAAETIITGVDAPIPAVITVTQSGEPATVENLSVVDAPQWGARVEEGRALTLRGVRIARAFELGIGALNDGTTITLEDVVISGTRPGDGGAAGRAISVEGGAHLEARRLSADDNHDIAIYAGNEGTTLELTDVVVSGTRPRVANRRLGRAISVELGARLDATRLVLDGNRDAGVAVVEANSFASITDAVIRNTLSNDDDGDFGRGVSVDHGGALEASRLLINDNRDVGVAIANENTSVVLEDVVIRDIGPRDLDGRTGRGISAQGGAQLAASRTLITRVRDMGVFVAEPGTSAALTDVAVYDVEADILGEYGRGIQAQGGAVLTGARVMVRGARGGGLVGLSGSRVDATDISVTDVSVSACAVDRCPELPLGYAVLSASATLRLERFVASRGENCGILLGTLREEPAEVDLRAGLVSECAIGACVQVDDYDLGRLTEDVEYRDNETNLDVTRLPIPSPVPLDG